MKYVMRAHSCALIGISLFLVGCGKNQLLSLPAPSGESVQMTDQYPSVAKLILPGGTGLCTGTFISPRAFLTAAHCTKTTGAYTIIAKFGTFTTSTTVSFGNGDIDDVNDISVLVLNSDVASGDQIMNIGSKVSVGDVVRLIGYGTMGPNSKTGAGVKRTGTNLVYDIDSYIELITPTSSASGRAIGGPSNLAETGPGDSGGPLALPDSSGNLTMVGVTHAGGTGDQGDLSQFIDMTRNDNRNFIAQVNQQYSLGIAGF